MDDILKCQEALRKISEQNYELEHQIDMKTLEVEYQRTHDELTGLSNNIALLEILKSNKNRSYCILNIDNFANINSAFGYEVGSSLLKEVSRLLNIIKPKECDLYRSCADQFVLINQASKSEEEMIENIEAILSFFNASDIVIDEEILIPVSFTIGVSTTKGTQAITQAELALKEVRKSRRNGYCIYNQKIENLSLQQENVYWINKIKESILNEDIIVHYQPILNNHTQKIEKYECLSRIDDEGTLVSPFSFMEAAISTRVLHLMTQAVIESACKKFSQTEYEFSINVTKDDLFMNYLEEFLLKNCKKYSISPSRIVLEILEDISSLDVKNILDQLDSLKMNGFQIAIDDFGAESSNFSRLLEFKPDYLKIDGAFIKDIATDKNSRIITEAITSICKQSDIKVIAEYIHNKEVLEIVKELGIDYSQGYYIGAPSTELVED